MPSGSVPDQPREGAGKPVDGTVKLPRSPTTNVVEAALVMCGLLPTMIERGWGALGVILLSAVMVRLVVAETVGGPASRAVPLPLSVKVSPAGRAPVSVIEAGGAPVVDTAKDPGSFRVKYAGAPLAPER